MTDHAGCMLAIVGSRDVPAVPARDLIRKVLAEHRPVIVITGGSKASYSNRMRGLVSVDIEAAAMARESAIQVVEFMPTDFHWEGEHGFKERNIKIAESCVCLVRIASDTTTTYGSGWTADHAEGLGKDVMRYTIMPDGTTKEGKPAHEQR